MFIPEHESAENFEEERELQNMREQKPKEDEQLTKMLRNITRLEVINHAKNEYPIGRQIVLYKHGNGFNNIEIQFQDDNKTLKLFIS